MNKKHCAKKTEELRVKSICEHINNKTPIGELLAQHYFENFNKNIQSVKQAGRLKDHFDIIITHTDGTTNNCEEKGTETYHSNINNLSSKPWHNSVQFYNGLSKRFSIARKYLQIWYDLNVNNNDVKDKYDLPSIPNFEDWSLGGPYSMIDPKSEYSKALKRNFKSQNNNNSMGGHGKNNNDIDYRVAVSAQFEKVFNHDDKLILMKETQEEYNKTMNAKESWLQTTGDPNTQFSFKWYNNIEPLKIVDVILLKKKDIEFKFILEDNSSFIGIMRWGKGCGFSCFRMDFK